MYSGIVEGVGVVKEFIIGDVTALTIMAEPHLLAGLKLGDSVGINGVCLTVVERTDNTVLTHLVPETLEKTNLSQLRLNAPVNIERPMLQDARNGGHSVQGHVDGMGKITEIKDAGAGAILLSIEVAKALSLLIVDKGFVSIDGMSITVIKAYDTYFTVTLIPYTQAHTIAKHYKVGSLVNIETDILGKYIAKYVEKFVQRSNHVH